MANKNIACVGTEIPGETSKEIDLNSKDSLLDYDIIIVDPDFHWYSDSNYQGRSCLNDTNSFRLKDNINHWRREIQEAIKAGKNVFFLLNKKKEVYIATGEKSFSGTGRNRQTTRHVNLISNYEIIPNDITVTNSNGSSMTLVGKDNILATYWSELGRISKFKVLLDGEMLTPIVQTKTGQKVVGAKLNYNDANGNLILLPYIDFNLEKYTYEKELEDYWTDEAIALGRKLINAICAINRAIKSTDGLSAIPTWITQDKFLLPKEKKVRQKLVTIEAKIEALQKQKEQYEQEITKESILKRLLYESGKPLEAAVHIALKYIGFKVSHFENSESEFDVVFESDEGRLVGEVEGKDNKAINITKLRQLQMNIHEDFEREDIDEMAKGALIGNAYRLTPPEEREGCFTKKCLTAANQSGTALISTTDLFYIAKYISGKNDKLFAKKCRKAIITTTGPVSFPDIPKLTKKQ